MKKKEFVLWDLSVLFCLVLLAGCTQSSATTVTTTATVTATATITTSPPSPVIPTTTVTQGATVNIPSFANLITIVQPCVVEINVTATVFTGRRTVQQQGAGSGWIIDANGTIVTNDHVVTGATTITVTTSDGNTFPATVINEDPVADLALIKINATTQLPAMKIGDASKLRSGDWVLAIGNPLGEGIIVTQGIVSRMGVSVPYSSTQTYNDMIETTAPINPGNSGGPLINMAGEVVGITTLGASGYQGMGYAISMVDAVPVIQKLSGK
jgi:serine protease Do